MGVKAEVEKTRGVDGLEVEEGAEEQDEGEKEVEREGRNDWIELTVEIPGYRDDDSGTAFLAAMLSEALLADGGFAKKLWINRRFHWKLYLDVRGGDWGFGFLWLTLTGMCRSFLFHRRCRTRCRYFHSPRTWRCWRLACRG